MDCSGPETSTTLFFFLFHKTRGGLPWWLSGKEYACQCRRHVFDPWSRKIPHASEQLSLCTTHYNYGASALEPGSCNYQTHVPQLLKAARPRVYAPQQEKPPQREAHTLQLESSSCSPQIEKKPVQQKDPAQPKISK